MKAQRVIIQTDKAPAAVGPYSQAVKHQSLVFASGQLPVDPQTGELISTHFEAQVRQVLNNLEAVLLAAGASLDSVLKLTVFMTDLNYFSVLNNVFSEYFPKYPPARSTIQVNRLPKDVMVEIEAVAIVVTE